MKNLILTTLAALFSLASLVGCSSAVIKPTKYDHPVMRVMIDPESIDNDQYVRLLYAIKQSNNFFVVDRAAGFKAAKKEQELQNKTDAERFGNREKYAHWGKLYGVRGIIVAHVDCKDFVGMFAGNYLRCDQDLQLIDANTGEVIAVSNAISEGEYGRTIPHWTETVEILNENVRIDTRKDQRLKDYEDETEKRSLASQGSK